MSEDCPSPTLRVTAHTMTLVHHAGAGAEIQLPGRPLSPAGQRHQVGDTVDPGGATITIVQASSRTTCSTQALINPK